MFLGTLGARLLGNLLTGKGILRGSSGRHLSSLFVLFILKNKKGKGIIRVSTGNNIKGKEWDF